MNEKISRNPSILSFLAIRRTIGLFIFVITIPSGLTACQKSPTQPVATIYNEVSQNGSGSVDVKEVHISIAADAHVSGFINEDCIRDEYKQAQEHLRRLIEIWEADKELNVAILLGDLLELEYNKDVDNPKKCGEEWPEHADAAHATLVTFCAEKKENQKLLSIIGNNDWEDSDINQLNSYYRTFAHDFCSNESSDADEKEIEYWWIEEFEDDNIAVIGLYLPDRSHYRENSCVRLEEIDGCLFSDKCRRRDDDDQLPSWIEQKKWLRQELENLRGPDSDVNVVFVLTHQPLVWHNSFRLPRNPNCWGAISDEPIQHDEQAFFQAYLVDLIEVLRVNDEFHIMTNQGISADNNFNIVVLSGHYHIGRITSEYMGLDFILVPSLATGDRDETMVEIVWPPDPIYADLIYYSQENKLLVEIKNLEGQVYMERTIHFENATGSDS